MKVLIRRTVSGTEYWDTEAKKTLFVPTGEKPNFEITVNPESMIGGVDLATGKDKTVVNGKVVEPKTVINPKEMDIEQLISFGEENGIVVPGNMKKEDTIRNFIIEELNAAADATDSK